jgi:hypothetical protein
MLLTAAALVVLSASPDGDRLLLCRPRILGDAALARADAVPAAARGFGQRFMDYGVTCDGAEEAARAARRAGLRHALSSTADGRTTGSRFVLTLSDAEGERAVASRELEVAPGVDPVPPLESALRDLVAKANPPSPDPGPGAGPWILAGAGAAVALAGVGFAVAAQSAASAADGANTAQEYVDARNAWKARRTTSAVLLGAGVAAVAAGLVWRFAF